MCEDWGYVGNLCKCLCFSVSLKLLLKNEGHLKQLFSTPSGEHGPLVPPLQTVTAIVQKGYVQRLGPHNHTLPLQSIFCPEWTVVLCYFVVQSLVCYALCSQRTSWHI